MSIDKNVAIALRTLDEELLSAHNSKINLENSEQNKQASENLDEENKKNKILSLFLAIFNVGKKVIDIGDDAWSATRRFLSDALVTKWNPLLIGITVGLINPVEAALGLKRAYKAYKDKENKKGQRYSRITVGVASFMLGSAGTGMAISLIASAFGASVAAVGLMPALIPACLFVIYNLNLIRKAYTFHHAKQQEEVAKNAYYLCLKENREELQRIHALGQNACDKDYDALQEKIRPLREAYQHYREKRLDAERKVAMNTGEVVASAFVLSGIVLGSAAIFGITGVASFGMVPLALIVTGVTVGLTLKIFESVDSKSDHHITHGIRHFFTNAWDRLFHKKPENKQKNLAELKKRHSSSTTANLFRSTFQKNGLTTQEYPIGDGDSFYSDYEENNDHPPKIEIATPSELIHDDDEIKPKKKDFSIKSCCIV